MLRVAATNSIERAFRRAPLAASLSAASLPYASSGEISPAAISASVAWLRLWSMTGGDGVVGLPEFLPQVGVGQVFPSFPSGEAVDHIHTVSPDDDLLRGSPGQSEAARSSALATD